MKSRFIAAPLLALALAALLGAGDVARDAAQKVREGLGLFEQGEFEQAAEAFAAAAAMAPDEPRIAYNRGCALAAGAKHDEAVPFLQDAALARDPQLSVSARYNLGCLAAEQAKTLFGDEPMMASPETRTEGLALLMRAVGHYRDVLRIDPDHADARHNLELIRLWIKRMRELWKRRDREQERQGKDLLQLLLMLEEQQIGHRRQVRTLAAEPDSPLRHEALSQTATAQRELVEELPLLKSKIREALSPQPPDPAAGTQPPPPADPQEAAAREQGIQMLSKWVDEAGEAMTRSAEEIDTKELDDAAQSQTAVLERFNELYTAVAPFPHLVQRALQVQEELVRLSLEAAPAPQDEDPKPDNDDPTTDDDQTAPAGAATGTTSAASPGPAPPKIPMAEQIENQQRVGQWSQVMAIKAAADLESLEPPDDSELKLKNPDDPAAKDDTTTQPADDPSKDQPTDDPPPSQPADKTPNTDPPVDDEQPAPTDNAAPSTPASESAATDDAPPTELTPEQQAEQQAQQQLEAMRRALRKAIELAPQVPPLADAAAEKLSENNPAEALPPQQSAEKILREIADELPKQDPQQQQQQGDQGDNRQQQDSQQQDDGQSDSQSQDEQQQDRQSGDDPSQQQQQEPQDEQDGSAANEQQRDGDEQQEMSRQQAEAVLQRIRERDRKHREMQEQLQRLLVRPVPVEKDW